MIGFIMQSSNFRTIMFGENKYFVTKNASS